MVGVIIRSRQVTGDNSCLPRRTYSLLSLLLPAGIAPEQASFEDIAAYIRPQLPGMPQPAASATLQLRLSAIRLWFDYLIYMG